ncbi:MAG TPA: alpha/beta hydrolase [Candidatus Limnocylindrales bacterium]|nr:alpha/beta hydrolase [Candidatus Limnocylindrales bacterium]
MTNTTLQTVTSEDGTTLVAEVTGSGPAIVLVSGGSVDRGGNAGLAAVLSADFTVWNFDRRGRGDSGDTAPYAVEREIEDIEAVIAAAGGHAHLYGTSSGAGLALEAAAAGAAVDKLVLWEPPYNVDPAGRPPADSVEQLDRMVAEGRRDDAATFFMVDMVGLPAAFVAFARTQPWWAGQLAIAHTLAYDARIMGDYSVPTETAARVTVPTLILTGGSSFDLFRPTADALVAAMPDGRTAVLDGQEHNVDPAVLGPAIGEFLAA